MSSQYENLSSDLIWEVTRNTNSFLVKRRLGSGKQVVFSRDPLNLVNKHSRKYVGYVNDKAIGINADDNTVLLTTKLASRGNKPAAQYQTASFSASTPSRKLYTSIVNSTAKKGYRPDLRAEAVARASAIKSSQRDNKKTRVSKPRGKKAQKSEFLKLTPEEK
ncbi:60S ribosomal protein L28 [Sphaerulina musiva SO2202]|uniref:60S ribosomal protein L28 n=1 Tax=Sphaerulina musiva (strain SO2202) TaxID=692275 RepID=N1QL93_SPHMS|nr:60S ribosomal protein L28 [Sphaerulina musiva SO2202]EMF11966.1 60S ribosomal protein L28 [Sphaerulina musiva SO2202]